MPVSAIKTIHDRMGYLFTFGAADTTLTKTINNCAEVKAVAIGTSTFANGGVTAQATIVDPLPAFTGYSVTLFTSQAVASNASAALVAGEDITAAEKGSILVDRDYHLTVTLSGAPGSGGAAVLVVLYFKH